MPLRSVLRLLVLVTAGFAVGAGPCAWDTPPTRPQTSRPTQITPKPLQLSSPEIRHDNRAH
ncbi:hypothetical protein GCM10007036_43270 [Alsobacter metallidurans]|uniref:Uncharacterized protein n=1 Tax=Alsobacter metallidurans TaxID=340221 RepID=A0A917MLS5_9HYPH|nr:hypothetical protein GCM10007036_43270 [Alsobacter metallidurans]